MADKWDDAEAKQIIEAYSAEVLKVLDDPNTEECSNGGLAELENYYREREGKLPVSERKGPLLVTGEYPGTGKSSLAMRWARTAEKRCSSYVQTKLLLIRFR